MIIGNKLEQLALVLPEAAAFLKAHPQMDAIENGRHELGNGHFANVSSYEPRPRENTAFEAHNAYADIQIIAAGAEIMEVADRDTLCPQGAFNEEDDYVLFEEGAGQPVLLVPGTWCLVMPEDAHRPGIATENAGTNKKIVIKMKLA